MYNVRVMTTHTTSQATIPGLFFRPIHPLNFPYKELLSESEEPSGSWPAVTRVIELYEDLQGGLQLMVCFRPAKQPGHIDNVRCYVASLGPRSTAGDVGQLAAQCSTAAAHCEAQMLPYLCKLHGDPAP
jgi:hypothetical protein